MKICAQLLTSESGQAGNTNGNKKISYIIKYLILIKIN